MGFLDQLKRGFLYNSRKITTDKDHIVRHDKKYIKKLEEASKELEAIANENTNKLDEIAIKYNLDKVIYMTSSYDDTDFVVHYDREHNSVSSVPKEELLKSNYYIYNFNTYGSVKTDSNNEKIANYEVYCNKSYIKSVNDFTFDELVKHFEHMPFVRLDKNMHLLEFMENFVITKSVNDTWTVITFTTEKPLVMEQKEKSNG